MIHLRFPILCVTLTLVLAVRKPCSRNKQNERFVYDMHFWSVGRDVLTVEFDQRGQVSEKQIIANPTPFELVRMWLRNHKIAI
jgi:hypothetical protein